jgi:hypothetical protein
MPRSPEVPRTNSKTVDVARHPWVRIPSLPPATESAGVDSPAEAWPSGRRHTPGKRVGGQLPRGFEPLSLRHGIASTTCGFPKAVVRRSVLGPCPLRQGGIPDHLQAVSERLHLGREQMPVGVEGDARPVGQRVLCAPPELPRAARPAAAMVTEPRRRIGRTRTHGSRLGQAGERPSWWEPRSPTAPRVEGSGRTVPGMPDPQPQAPRQPTLLLSRPMVGNLTSRTDFVGSVACPWWPVGMPRVFTVPRFQGQGRPPGQASRRAGS